jgi:hypothetical protein
MSIINNVVNAISNLVRKPAVVATPAYINPYTFRVAAITTYGDLDGRYVKMEIGMPVDGFKRWYSCNMYDNAVSAANNAREFSRCDTLYAVTNDGIIVATFYQGYCVSRNM